MLKTHVNRCSWPTNDEQYLTYHDQEWGRVVHDDRRLFEQLVLEGAQAGLSWLTILKRRHHYKRVFCQYDVVRLDRKSTRLNSSHAQLSRMPSSA
jgi:DNA-3-methyladenine glycosylase I